MRLASVTSFQRHRLPPWLAITLLGVFLAVRGAVPAGLMPGSLAGGGSLYELCHGDSRSALLLNLATGGDHASHQDHAGHHNDFHGSPPGPPADPHSGHQHDDATAQAFADNHCSFSAAASAVTSTDNWQPLLPDGNVNTTGQRVRRALRARHYLLPPGRAPPAALALT